MTPGVALVTGSSRGIGRAIALRLAADGFDMVLNAKRQGAELAATAKEVRACGRAVTTVVADVSDLDSHARLLNAAAELGGLRCLVNNAGVSVLNRADLLDAAPESYDRCMAINTRGPFFLTQRAARAMLADAPTAEHRSIVFISSINAITASITRGEYCMSKAAVSMMTRLYALRLATAGIGVYEVQPGLIRTDMTAQVHDQYDALIADGLLPMARWGEPEDVANTVGTLVAGKLPYTVGQALQVDGGLSVTRF